MYEYTRLKENMEDVEPNYNNEMCENLENLTNIKSSVSVGIQTNYDFYTSFKALPESIDLEFESEDVYFKHLAFANQTYWQHFMDSIKYSFISLKASFYFFCHAVWPDIFIKNGSETINALSERIYKKYQKRIQEIIEDQNNREL